MCAMCGVLGGADHWADAHARPGVFTRNGSPLERRRERMRRVAFANVILVHFGLTLSDWQGTSFVLSTRTGKSAMVDKPRASLGLRRGSAGSPLRSARSRRPRQAGGGP